MTICFRNESAVQIPILIFWRSFEKRDVDIFPHVLRVRRDIRGDIQANPPAFTMSSDLPFAIFRYDPFHPEEREWHVRREIQKLATRVHNTTNRDVHILQLSQFYWKSINML